MARRRSAGWRWVNDRHIGDRFCLALASRVVGGSIAVQIGLYGLGVQCCAIVEDDTRPQLQGQSLAIFVPAPFAGELWSIVQLCIDVDKLVAQRGKDDTADERSSLRRIEAIRILLQANA